MKKKMIVKYLAIPPRVIIGILASLTLGYTAIQAQDNSRIVNLGKNGWLFLTTEVYSYPKDADSRILDKLVIINRYLKSKGVNVIFTLIPTKYDMYGEYDGSGIVVSKEKYDIFKKKFEESGLNYVDARSLLNTGKDEGKLVWMRRDIHMSPQGGELLGRGIGSYINRHFPLSLNNFKPYIISHMTVKYPVDLWQFLDERNKELYDKFETITIPKVNFSGNKDTLVDDNVPKITLVGSSFSIRPSDSIAVGIQEITHNDVLDVGIDGGGIWGSMDKYLSDESYKKSPPAIIVWEMPELIMNENVLGEIQKFPEVQKILSGH